MLEALYYQKEEDGTVLCLLCPHHCHIADGYSGRCRTRFNGQGTLYVSNYGHCTAAALDPIEKKPLYQFHPGSYILSVGSWGCNLACMFCQNWQISQEKPPYHYLSPSEAVDMALMLRSRGNIGIAYTYNEPAMTYEWIMHTAPLLHQHGLANVVVTNGFIEETPLRQLLPHIDAWNIDLKSITDKFYQAACSGALSPVQRSIELAAAVSHVEVTTLIIPGLNDSDAEIKSLALWLSRIDRTIPLHLTRYFPRYRLHLPPTPIATLNRLCDIASQYLDTVYAGNI